MPSAVLGEPQAQTWDPLSEAAVVEALRQAFPRLQQAVRVRLLLQAPLRRPVRQVEAVAVEEAVVVLVVAAVADRPERRVAAELLRPVPLLQQLLPQRAVVAAGVVQLPIPNSWNALLWIPVQRWRRSTASTRSSRKRTPLHAERF